MNSRIRENVSHIFECFCEVANACDGEPWIVQKFPDSYNDEEVLASVPKFAYPCEFDNSVVQHYSFVLTSIDSKWTFGFCRHDPKSETALVLLSYLPWHETFYKLLNQLSELLNSRNDDSCLQFLSSCWRARPPEPESTVHIPIQKSTGTKMFICKAPRPFQLPSIPENRNLSEYYNAVDCENMISVFASMLFERRIVFTSKKLSRLSACVQAANAIIYPMSWQHIFIPVLPSHLVDYLLAPMPYLIGVPHTLIQKVHEPHVGEIVILDADSNCVKSKFDDVAALPSSVVRQLRNDLRNKKELVGDGVSRAFLRALVHLIGGYRDALRFNQGERITFDEEAFIQSRPANIQPFLKSMLHLQIFQQFIDERLNLLNAGQGFSDEFEIETCNYCDKTSSRLKAQYKDWTHTMKRESTAFLKNVKTKANPAVRSAVKTVKERGKDVSKAYRGIRSKLKDRNKSGAVQPPTTFVPNGGLVGREDEEGRVTSVRKHPSTTAVVPTSWNEMSFSCPDGLQLSPIDMDLMGELHHVLFDPNLEKLKMLNGSAVVGSNGFCESGAPHSLPNSHVGQVPSNSHKADDEKVGDLIRLDSDEALWPPKSSTTQESEKLLLEYGLDFSSLALSPPPPNHSAPSSSNFP